MRWERLFHDLEAQLEQAERAELGAEVADRTRREVGRLRLADRLRASVGCEIAVWVAGAGVARGAVRAAGGEWLLLAERPGAETLVPLRRVVSVAGLGNRAEAPGSGGAVEARLGLRYVLRGIVRDRTEVTLTLVDGTTMIGVIDRVGADFIDMVDRDVVDQRVRAVPIDAMATVRRSV